MLINQLLILIYLNLKNKHYCKKFKSSLFSEEKSDKEFLFFIASRFFIGKRLVECLT